MCVEGFRVEEACAGGRGRACRHPAQPEARTRTVLAVPPGTLTLADSDSDSYSTSAALCCVGDCASPPIDSLPDAAHGRQRTANSAPPVLDLPAAPDDMDNGNDEKHPTTDYDDDDFLTASIRDDVFMVGKKPSPDEIAVARSRLVRRLASMNTSAARASSRTSTSLKAHPVPDEQLDVLARATASFRVLLQRATDALEACQRSHYFSVLSRTTQPAHIVTFLSMALLAMLLFPRHAKDSTTGSTTPTADVRQHSAGLSPWIYLTYVVAFAAHFGSQFWMTFVSGLSLFFSLPRHHFAEVQKVLFPLYFAINAALSLVTLAAFLRLKSGLGSLTAWDAEVVVQVASMVLCFLLELLVRLYLTPPLLRFITAKTEMEKTVDGVGQEVGRYDLGPLTQCPHYVKIHQAFRKVHATIAVANITAMACTALHAHYLAGKICV